MSTDFATLDALKVEWDALQPLAPDRERRLWKKLRLEWNYHSNHIEGNTLTYGETELLLLHGQAVGDHPLRDYEEMKAHDAAIEYVRRLATERDRLLTEADIRDLNQIILKEPFWKAAQTFDGQPTRKQIIPGQYKTTPNNVRTATGEIFEFASVEDAPPRMADLASWLRESLISGALHPVFIASKLHHDFVLIHPFDDGNGRVARLLVNYVLLRAGFPPVIVRSEDKPAYLTALRKADAGELDALTDYLATALNWSLSIAIRAGKGEPIEEPSDVEKEVAIFVRDQEARKKGEVSQTRQSISDLISVSLRPFVEKADVRLRSLTRLFRKLEVHTQDGLGTIANGDTVDFRAFTFVGPGESLRITFYFHGYQGDAPLPFDHTTSIGLHFPPGRFSITHDEAVIVSGSYDRPVLGDESEALTAHILATTFGKIKAKAGIHE
jgi:Fic/DOC family